MKFRSLFVAFAAMLILPALAIAEPPTGKGNDKGSGSAAPVFVIPKHAVIEARIW